MNKGRIVQAASAVEVYRNPAAYFVDSFIGNPPMNFLDAKPAGDGYWEVAGVGVPGPASDQPSLQFGIRPEDITVHPADASSATQPLFTATVRILEPLGSHLLASCKIGDQMLRVVMDSDAVVKPGDELR